MPLSSRIDRQLLRAAAHGEVEKVQSLLSKGAAVNIRLAASLDRGPYPRATLSRTEDGDTPLHLAARNGHAEVARLLLDAEGIDVNAVNVRDNAPLNLAAAYGSNDVVKLLLNAEGIDVNTADDTGDTPFHDAVSYGHIEAAQLLLNAGGININVSNNNGDTPLHRAIPTKAVRVLVNADGININAANNNGDTPLHLYVAKYGDDEVANVRVLLEAEGVSVNAANKNGRTPLHIAVRWGDAYTVQALLNTKEIDAVLNTKKIDANGVDNEGHTPLDIAKQRNDSVIVALLEGFLNRVSHLTFHQVEQEYKKRKRHKSMVDLTGEANTGEHIQPDETVIPLRAQVELHRIKQEKETSLDSLDVARATVAELTQKLEAAKKDEMALKETLEDMKECIACQEADKCIAFFPCRHLALCATCSKNESIVTCPMCRCVIKERREVKVVS